MPTSSYIAARPLHRARSCSGAYLRLPAISVEPRLPHARALAQSAGRSSIRSAVTRSCDWRRAALQMELRQRQLSYIEVESVMIFASHLAADQCSCPIASCSAPSRRSEPRHAFTIWPAWQHRSSSAAAQSFPQPWSDAAAGTGNAQGTGQHVSPCGCQKPMQEQERCGLAWPFACLT